MPTTTMIKFEARLGEFYLARVERLGGTIVLAQLHETKFREEHLYGAGNVPVTARLIHQFCEGFAGSNADIAPYVEMVKTLLRQPCSTSM